MTASHITPQSGVPSLPPRQFWVVGLSLLALIVIAGMAVQSRNLENGIGVLIGGFAGFALYHASFGFTGAWRRIVAERRGNGLRAQMILIGLVCIISYPLFDYGADFGMRTGGAVAPWGVGSAIGAFMFGFGMQFGGGCASGTLFTSGGGSSRMVVTLAFFILGSAIATAHTHWWAALPRFGSYSFVRNFGAPGALMITFALLGAIYAFSVWIERRAWGEIEDLGTTGSLLTGPWSKLAGALALVIVSVATLLVLHRPWGITSGFALWGAKWFQMFGIPVETWPYWSGGRSGSLNASVFSNSVSVMNFGIIFGAMTAAGLAGKYAPKLKMRPIELATAIVGGLLMGYGARLAYGCNIGAYLGGLVSGSMHGWWWLIFGFAGSLVSTRLKVRFQI